MTDGGLAGSPAAITYLSELQTMTTPQEVAEYSVDHLLAMTVARWAEVVQTNPTTGALTTLAAADAELAEELQQCRIATGEPPAPDAPGLPTTIVFDDLEVSSPWPDFAEIAVARTPVRSAVLTYTPVHNTAIVVPVYDDRIGYFTTERRQYADLVARLVGLVLTRLAMEKVLKQLSAAMRSRQHVGNAVGVLCVRQGLTPEAAFDLLRVASSHTNRKLRDIATDVIAGGDLPSGDYR